MPPLRAEDEEMCRKFPPAPLSSATHKLFATPLAGLPTIVDYRHRHCGWSLVVAAGRDFWCGDVCDWKFNSKIEKRMLVQQNLWKDFSCGKLSGKPKEGTQTFEWRRWRKTQWLSVFPKKKILESSPFIFILGLNISLPRCPFLSRRSNFYFVVEPNECKNKMLGWPRILFLYLLLSRQKEKKSSCYFLHFVLYPLAL